MITTRLSVQRGLAALLTMVAVLAWSAPALADDIRAKQWHLTYLRIAEAQRISQGEGVTVGLIDTGVNAAHPDLAGNVLAGTDFYRPPGDGLTDRAGHGTAMAGLIAAHGHDGGGALGIAPKAKILSVTAGGGFIVESTTAVAQGIQWAIQHGATVLCVAFGGNDEPLLEAAVKAAAQADVVVVAAAGNLPEDDQGLRFPAGYPGVVAAAGIDKDGNHAAISVEGKGVVLSAPAQDITSTAAGGAYGLGVGTSDSTAIIAGVAALIRAKFPKLSAPEVVRRMTATAVDKGAPGLDNTYGYGVVDPVAALTKTVGPAPSPTVSSVKPIKPPGGGHAQPQTPSQAAVLVAVAAVVLVAAVLVTVVVIAVLLRKRATRRRRRSDPSRWPPYMSS